MENKSPTHERAARRTMARGSIQMGTRLSFLNGGPDPWEGVVNGAPWIFWDGVNAEARIRVNVTHAPGSPRMVGETMDVAGSNVFRVYADVR